jgi:hypothetical protein
MEADGRDHFAGDEQGMKSNNDRAALWGGLPKYATSTEVLGRAMIKAARSGAPKRVLESQDINAL